MIALGGTSYLATISRTLELSRKSQKMTINRRLSAWFPQQ